METTIDVGCFYKGKYVGSTKHNLLARNSHNPQTEKQLNMSLLSQHPQIEEQITNPESAQFQNLAKRGPKNSISSNNNAPLTVDEEKRKNNFLIKI